MGELSAEPAIDLVVCITREWSRFHRRLPIEVLAELLTPEDRIWVVNRPLDLLSSWRTPRRILEWRRIEQVHERLSVLTPLVPIHDQLAFRLPAAENLVLKSLRKQLLPLLRPGSRKVLWLMHPSFFFYTRLLSWDFLLYDCYDEFIMPAEGTPRLVEVFESILFHAADETIVAAELVGEKKKRDYGAERMRLITNPTSYRLFSRARDPNLSLPDDLAAIPAPRVGYVGGIKPLLDQELLRWLAQRLRQVSFVLLGDLEASTSLAALLREPNVYWLGYRPPHLLPAYLKGLHVGLVPYLQNEQSRALNPNKAIEYLMAGLEVVSVPIPALEGKFPGLIHIQSTREGFLADLQACLARPPRTLPEADLAENSWERQLIPLIARMRQGTK